MKTNHLIWITPLLTVLCLTPISCKSNPSARIMADDEEDIVGTKRAGAPTYDRLIEGVVGKLLRNHSTQNSGSPKLLVASLPIENSSGEELGDWSEQLYELIDTSINTSSRYRNVSIRFVNAALREGRLRPDQLYLPTYRRQFLKILEAKGMPVECLLYSKLTTGTTEANDLKQRNYMLTLELVDLKTGWNEKESERLRKEYSK